MKRSDRVVIATRQSELALWQARHVAGLLRQRHPDLQVELLPLTTQGDRILDRPLARIGGKGLFLKELEAALLDGRADIAVHSMKDVPVQETVAVVVAALRDGAAIAVPRYRGRRGHPVGFSRAFREELLALDADTGGRDIIARNEARVTWIEVDDPGIVRDIDIPADIEAAQH